MIKYMVTQKVEAEDEVIEKYGLDRFFDFEKPNFIAYKITAGLYIFYITHATYEQGVKEGIIIPISSELPILTYSTMRLMRGLVVNHRMPLALKLSTIDYLKSELLRVNEDPKIVSVKTYAVQWWDEGVLLKEPILTYCEEIKVNLEDKQILKYTRSSLILDSIFHNVKTYENFLDTLANELDREYMNSRNLFDKFKEFDFYEQDYWLQKLRKFVFSFQ